MKYLIYLLAIIVLLGLNVGLFNNLQIRGQMPNLVFLLALCFSFDKEDLDCFFVAFFGGLFLDAFSVNFLGGWTLALLLMALLGRFLSSRVLVMEINFKNLAWLAAAGWLVVNLALWFYGWAAFKLNLTPDYTSFRIFVADFLPGLLYNWLLLYPVYLAADWLKQLVEGFSIRRRGIVR